MPSAPPPAAAIATLRARGLRVSAARRLLIEALSVAGRPASAEELAGGVGGRVPPSDVASAYRNLETLERIGVVHCLRLGTGPRLYTLAAGEPPEYLACERCGGVRALEPGALDDVRAALRARFGHDARFSSRPLVGRCAACTEGEAPAVATKAASASGDGGA